MCARFVSYIYIYHLSFIRPFVRSCINSQAQPGARQHRVFLDHQDRLRRAREEVVGVVHVEVLGVTLPLVLELTELWVWWWWWLWLWQLW